MTKFVICGTITVMNDLVKYAVSELKLRGYYYTINSEMETKDVFDLLAFNDEEIKLIKVLSFYNFDEMNKKLKIKSKNKIKNRYINKEVWCYIRRNDCWKKFSYKGDYK